MNKIKKYSERGTYFIEIQAPTKRLAEQVMRKIEQAIEGLCALQNRGTGVIQWWFDAPEGSLERVEDDEGEENHAHKRRTA